MSEHRVLANTDDLVTGEAVALDLPPASVGLRLVSGLIDVFTELVLLGLVVLVAYVAASSSDEAVLAAVSVVGTVAVLVGWPTTWETVARGRTVGKLAVGLRTVRDDAGPISFRHALVRALVGFVEIWVLYGVPALISSLVTSKGKRVGDLAAGTYVVRERFAFPGVRPPYMPQRLAGWASTADIAPLPDGLALGVRQFLGRADSLNPVSRETLGLQLTDQVLRHVAPPPPPGEHPETVLAAVLAERRRRDEARLARDEQLRTRLRGRAGQPRR
ncbi:MAG: RDD family protein [Nocardioidaceae bacterium]|nr:RDD family protein [Nocardioidaceae bacterium]